MTEDRIDTSQWLPPKAPIVNARRKARGDLRVVLGDRGGREVRSVAHPLDLYLSRDRITRPQWDAGTRFAELWEIGYVRSQHARPRYGDPATRGQFRPGLADECRDAYDRACLALRDLSTRKLVFAVCCDERYAGRGGIEELRGGLDALYRHFYRNDRLD